MRGPLASSWVPLKFVFLLLLFPVLHSFSCCIFGCYLRHCVWPLQVWPIAEVLSTWTWLPFLATEGRCTTYSFSRSVLTTALVAPLCLKTLLSHELPFQYYTHSVVSWCVYILSHGYTLEDARERNTLSKDTDFPSVLCYRMSEKTFFCTQETPHCKRRNLWHKKLCLPSAGL